MVLICLVLPVFFEAGFVVPSLFDFVASVVAFLCPFLHLHACAVIMVGVKRKLNVTEFYLPVGCLTVVNRIYHNARETTCAN